MISRKEMFEYMRETAKFFDVNNLRLMRLKKYKRYHPAHNYGVVNWTSHQLFKTDESENFAETSNGENENEKSPSYDHC